MGTKRKIAVWRKDGRLFICRPPDWPHTVEYACTKQSEMIQWAQDNGYVLKYGGSAERKGGGAHERFAARDFG